MGFIYVTDDSNHCVQVFTMDGAFLGAFDKPGRGPGELDWLVSIHVSPERVYIAEYGNKRVSVFTTSGEFVF